MISFPSVLRRALRKPAQQARLERSLRALPPDVRRFYRRAHARARGDGDRFSLDSVSRPGHLATLLALARGRRNVVELGTGTAWATAALVVDDPQRRVLSFDPIVRLERERYLALLDESQRARIELVPEPGGDGAARAEGVELLFIDSSHERLATVAEFRAWRPRLAPGAVVVFDDYGHPDWPGVAQAVADLQIEGDVHGGLFVWRAPA
jgi:predicted O-methyltransferase YrrM